MPYVIRSLENKDRDAVAAQICHHWTLTRLGYIDHFIETYDLPGFVAEENGKIIASLTWRPYEDTLQIVTLISDVEGQGLGSALIRAAEEEAKKQGICRVLISTENSYVDALAFYQKRGYTLYRVHYDVIKNLRLQKPSIPEVDTNGIPIRDQIDLIKDVA